MRVRDMKFHDRFLSLLLSQLYITSHSDADALIAALVVMHSTLKTWTTMDLMTFPMFALTVMGTVGHILAP